METSAARFVAGTGLLPRAENVRQEKPLAFMVFTHNDSEVDYLVFFEENEARDNAMEQEESADAPENSWPVYALWASEWPLV